MRERERREGEGDGDGDHERGQGGPCNEALLALHAGGDAPSQEAAVLRGHLVGCADCRRVLAELRATRDWLQSNLAPAADAVLLAELRRRVMRRLSRERPLPRLVALVGRLCSSWRSAWHLPGGGQPLRGFGGAALLLLGALGALSGLQGRLSESRFWSPGASASSPLPPAAAAVVKRAEGLAADPGEPDDPAAEAEEPETDPPADPDPNLDNLDVTFDDPTPLPSGLRIELHTPDPNVRIIWFASNTTSVGSPRREP